MRIDYARGCFSDNELEAAYVRREWRRTTSTFAVTIVILIAALGANAAATRTRLTRRRRRRPRSPTLRARDGSNVLYSCVCVLCGLGSASV